MSAVPEDIYHYTKRKIALEYILFNKKIRFNLIGNTNDPKETKDISITRTIFKNEVENLETRQVSYSMKSRDFLLKLNTTARILRNNLWKVFCGSLNPSSMNEDFRNPFITNGFCRPRMWAHYGGNHSGVCLKFNGQLLESQIQKELAPNWKVFSGKVLYDDFGSILPEIIDFREIDANNLQEVDWNYISIKINKYLLENYEFFFLHKSKDWETENEYRWIIYSPDNQAKYVSIENCLAEVMVGVDFPKVYESSLIDLCKELRIPAGRILWENGIPHPLSGSIYKP